MQSVTDTVMYQHIVTRRSLWRAGCLTVKAGHAGNDCLVCCPEHILETKMVLSKTIQVVLGCDFWSTLLPSSELQVYFWLYWVLSGTGEKKYFCSFPFRGKNTSPWSQDLRQIDWRLWRAWMLFAWVLYLSLLRTEKSGWMWVAAGTLSSLASNERDRLRSWSQQCW